MASLTSSDTEFPLSVVMERRHKQRGQWRFVEWKAVGVLTGEEHLKDVSERRIIHEEKDCQRILWTNFYIRLLKDEAESYWNNLMAENPSIFVVARRDDEDHEPEPFLVTANYDEIIGYQEVDDDVYRLPLPADLYQWIERYVVNNYIPPERRKRKRTNWSATDHGETPPSKRRH